MSLAQASHLRPMHLPPVTGITLDNGLQVQVVPHGPVPLMSARLLVRVGSAADPPGRQGLADLTAQLLRRGTRRRSAQALDEAIEFVGGNLGIGVSADWLAVRVSAPSSELVPLLGVLAELVREPRFDTREVDSARERALAELASDRDDPERIADKALARHLWGLHPYADDGGGTLTSMARLRREDVWAFHKQWWGPRVALLTIVGAVKPQAAIRAARNAFGAWHGGPAAPPEVPVPAASPGAGRVLLIDGPELTQSHVRLAWRGPLRTEPGILPAFLVNHILGGGFTSRLVRSVRVRRGLTYGIGSHFDWQIKASSHEVSTSTQTAHTRTIIDVTLEEIARMKARGPTRVELAAAQRYVVGLYPTSVERNESLAAKLGDIWLYGLGADWVSRYRERMAAVTREEAVSAARKLLLPHPPAMVVVGNAEKIERRLKTLGPVSSQPLSEYE